MKFRLKVQYKESVYWTDVFLDDRHSEAIMADYEKMGYIVLAMEYA